MAAEIPIIIAAEFVPVVAPIRWSQLDVQDWAHVKPIRRRSSVWNFFSQYESSRKGKNSVAVCDTCYVKETRDADNNRIVASCDSWEINYTSDHSTSHLTQHLRHKHRALYDEFFLMEAKGTLEKEGGMNAHVTYGSDFMINYIKWSVYSYQSIRTCESKLFREMCESYNAKGKNKGHLCRTTVNNEIAKMSLLVKATLIEMYVDECIALTGDHWTSAANESYMAITAHSISKNWELVSTVLCCSPHKGDESGFNTEKVFRKSWESFGLDDSQIICIVTDTAPNMTAAGRLYHCYFSYCTNHVLELTTGFAFDDKNIPDADNIMKSCRALVGHFSSSPLAEKMLLEKQKQNPTCRPVGVIQDVATRWWSTFLMLERLLRLKAYFTLMEVEGLITCNLTDEQWITASDICVLLEPFMVAQKVLEGQKHVTISLVPYIIVQIREGLNTVFNAAGTKNSVKALTSRLLLSFNSQWGSGLPGTVFDEHLTEGHRRRRKGVGEPPLLGCVLDPRTKDLQFIPIEDQVSEQKCTERYYFHFLKFLFLIFFSFLA